MFCMCVCMRLIHYNLNYVIYHIDWFIEITFSFAIVLKYVSLHKASTFFQNKVNFLLNILNCTFERAIRPVSNGSPRSHPFYSPSSSLRPLRPNRRVTSTIIHHPVLFGTSDKFGECWRNYIKHKSVITSLYDHNEECTIDAHACLSLPFACRFYCVKKCKIASIIISS